MPQQSSSIQFQPLGRVGLVDRVVTQLSEAILQGRLKPGHRLSESVIAREMGVSRAPVREAARLLESSGLVAYQPNRGFFVRQISAKELEDLYDLRMAIETAAISRVIRDAPDDVLDGLQTCLDELRHVSAASNNMQAQVQADMGFHRALIQASGNPRFVTIFEQIARETELCIMVIGQLYDDPLWIADSHAPILDALYARDETRAIAILSGHLDQARRLVTGQFRALTALSDAE